MFQYEKQILLHQDKDCEIWLSSADSEKNQVVLRCFSQANGLAGIYRRLASLKHTNISQIFEVTETQAGFTVLEEYVHGVPISDLLLGGKAFSEREWYEYGLQLCAALKALHENGIVHRDVKPANLMLTDTGILKLIDFGAARFFDIYQDKDTRLLGTQGYAAPEQYGFSQTDYRTDIYALGVTMQEMAGSRMTYRQHKIIAKCMQLNPARRYQSIGAVERAMRPRRRYFVICGTLFAAALGGVLLFQAWDARPPASEIPQNAAAKEAPSTPLPETSTAAPLPYETAIEKLFIESGGSIPRNFISIHEENYWVFPSNGQDYHFQTSENTLDDRYVQAPYGDVDDAVLVSSPAEIQKIVFTGDAGIFFSHQILQETFLDGRWYYAIQFKKQLPSQAASLYQAEAVLSFANGETAAVPFRITVKEIPIFNFNVDYQDIFYAGHATEIKSRIIDTDPTKNYRYSWKIIDGAENAGFTADPSDPDSFWLEQGEQPGKDNVVTIYGYQPGVFTLRVMAFSTNTEGEQWVTGNRLVNVSVKPDPKNG